MGGWQHSVRTSKLLVLPSATSSHTQGATLLPCHSMDREPVPSVQPGFSSSLMGMGLSSGSGAPVTPPASSRCAESNQCPLRARVGRDSSSAGICPAASHQQAHRWLRHPSGNGHDILYTQKASARTELWVCQAFECCTQSMQISPDLFRQKSCLRCLHCSRTSKVMLNTPGQGRQAPLKGDLSRSLVPRHPD